MLAPPGAAHARTRCYESHRLAPAWSLEVLDVLLEYVVWVLFDVVLEEDGTRFVVLMDDDVELWLL